MVNNVKAPPNFDGLNFFLWKVKMMIFIQSLGSRVAKATAKSFVVPDGDENTWSKAAIKEFEANVKAHYALLQTLNDDDISRVINYKFAYERSNLIVTHERISLVKNAKIDLLHC